MMVGGLKCPLWVEGGWEDTIIDGNWEEEEEEEALATSTPLSELSCLGYGMRSCPSLEYNAEIR